MNNIIGISGKSKSGKTTLAEHLAAHLGGVVWGFGDEVKMRFYFDGPQYAGQLWRQDVKDTVLDTGQTIRQELVRIGIDRRKDDPDYWVKSWLRTLSNNYRGMTVIAPDVRFPNEVKVIERIGGIVIRLTRNPDDGQVETETALDDWQFRHVIHNDYLTINQVNYIGLYLVQQHLLRKGVCR